ncbi:MAG: glucose-6-phosphate isomerase, partial [Candidatus Aureabacteria bacterium]|nr:glucose-6-phosphate isomerase [Candidatus Auribacterota bacterium]
MSTLAIRYAHMMADVIGPGHGLSAEAIECYAARCGEGVAAVRREAGEGRVGFCALPFDTALVAEIETCAEAIAAEVDNFVVLGIGGSALGNIALHAALNHPFHNLLTREGRRGRPRIFVLDNSDPEFVGGALDVLDLQRTAINVVTKSGSTSETMAQCMVFLDRMRAQLGGNLTRGRVIATTDPGRGALRTLAEREGFRAFPIPPSVGGRFSVLSAVGLLSAAVSGIDIRALLAGARRMHEACLLPDASCNPAFMMALLQYLSCTEKGKSIAVMMP